MKLKAIALLTILLMANNLLAQEASIKGHVRDKKGEPVVGATITAAENSATAITDLNGDFVIDVPAGTKLQVSFIGLIPEKRKAVNNMVVTMSDKRSLSWNVRAGLNTSFYSDLFYYGSNVTLGFHAGVGMEIPFGNIWSLQPSLMLIKKGAETASTYDLVAISPEGEEPQEPEPYVQGIKFDPYFLHIPILIAAQFRLSDNANLVVGLGPYVEWAFGDMTMEMSTGREEVYDMFETGFDGRFYYGLAAQVKVEFNKIFFGFDGNYSLKKAETRIDEDNNLKIHTIGLTVGYKF